MKSSSGLAGRNESGREWITIWISLGAGWKGTQGESLTGKEQLSWVLKASMEGVKAAAGVVWWETRRVTDPLSLALGVTARGRVQFASLSTRAAMSDTVAGIRRDSG